MVFKKDLVLAISVVFLSVHTICGLRPAAIENNQSIASNAADCRDPNGVEGVCRHIKQCPIMLKDFVRLVNQRDESYIFYIRQSNAICTATNDPIICCPTKRKFDMGPLYRRKTNVKTVRGRLLTPEEGCGLGKPITRPRTINPAFQTKPGVYPWVVLIKYANGSLGECGGSLLTSRHVLTSAHCVNDKLSMVRLGAFDINLANDNEVQDIKVRRFIQHPDYNKTNRLNDIAILHLERDVEFTDRIRPICIPFREPIRSQSFVDYTPFIAAWLKRAPANTNAINIPPSNVMRDWQLTVLDNKECRKQYKSRSKTPLINHFDNSVICVDNIDAGKNDCRADSGLMQPIFNPKFRSFSFYQIGILAHGIGCKSNRLPIVYTRVQHFIDWIEKNIEQ